MEGSDDVREFQEYLENNQYDELLERVRTGKYYLVVDFQDLARFNPELANKLLETPEDVVKAAEVAVERFDLDADDFKIRFENIPESQQVLIRAIRSKHIDKLIQIEGIVRQKTDVRPQVTKAKFECPSCGNVINVVQDDKKFKKPNRCSCGRKGKFKLLSKELEDTQKIVIEESPEDLQGGDQPKRLNIYLKNDLVSPMEEKRTNPGSRIEVVGTVREVPVNTDTGAQSTRFDLIMEANNVEPVQEDYTQIEIPPDRVEELKELSNEPNIFDKLVKNVAPNIYGHEKVKKALMLQMMGGVQKSSDDGKHTRGDIHCLLIGDPGAGKSALLKRVSETAPKARYVSGPASTAAGLTATVVKDEFMRGYALEAGAMVLANKGVCCIDELDKMEQEDRSAMHEALEQQTVTVTKANIQATLKAQTTLLAAANPKFGRFDPYEMIAKQIDLPSTLINRFDLIFPIRDIPDEKKDKEMAQFILNLQKDERNQQDIPTEMMKDYVAYAKQNIFPVLLEGAVEEIKNYFVQMRNTAGDDGEGIQAIPISARQLEALVRLAEASARTRLSDKVKRKDAKRAIDLLHHCLSQIGMDPETGKIDIDRISTGVSASQRNHIHTVRDIIADLEGEDGKTIHEDEILERAQEEGVEERKVEEVIDELKRSGDIFEPEPGKIQRL